MPKPSRLAKLFSEFASGVELPYKLDTDRSSASIGIPHDKHVIHARYSFDKSQDSYEYGAALGQIDKRNLGDFVLRLLTSKPIRGITERITQEGKYIVFGSRSGLKSQSDVDVRKAFMDDIARISEANKLFNKLK